MKRWFSFTPSTRITTLLLAAVWLASSVFLSGCADSAFTDQDPAQDAAMLHHKPPSSKVRHAHLFDRAVRRTAG